MSGASAPVLSGRRIISAGERRARRLAASSAPASVRAHTRPAPPGSFTRSDSVAARPGTTLRGSTYRTPSPAVTGSCGPAYAAPRRYAAAEAAAYSASAETKSTRSCTCRQLPQANTPGTLVISAPSTSAPPVTGSIRTPQARASSFSGIRPTERISASQAISRSLPGTGLPDASTALATTPVRCARPRSSVTVVDRRSGMLKSCRHCRTLRCNPLQ